MSKIIAVCCAALIGLFLLTTPQVALDNVGFLLFLALPIMLVVVAFSSTKPKEPRSRRSRGHDRDDDVALAPLAVPILVGIVVLFVGYLVTCPMFRASSYHELLGVEKVSGAKQPLPLPPIDLTNAPLVSYDMAMRAAEKRLAEVPALGSQAQVGVLQKQLIANKLYWVGFLEFRSFFSWNNRGTTPGYVKVSATDPSDVSLVTELNGKPLAMTYLESAYFGKDALRHLRLNGYLTTALTDFSPEVDDDGRPFLVATTFERRVGFSGDDATGVVVLDVQTGESHFYSVANTPAWIDRIQPESIVKEQLEDRLDYVHGFFNPSKEDKLTVAGDLDVIYGTNGRAYFFAGLTSTAKKEGALVGFVIIDTRTKEIIRFNQQGVTQAVAEQAAIGVMPQMHYTATNPLPFLVDDVPTYVMTLRDATGIARFYAMVDIRDYQKVATGDTLAATAREFQAKRNLSRTAVDAAPRADEVVVTARVLRIGMDVRAGNSGYVMVLEGMGTKLFTADTNRADSLPVTQPGDMVELQTVLGEKGPVSPILAFKNLTLAALPSASAGAASSAK